jgi:DNA-binding NtrC family response regulator
MAQRSIKQKILIVEDCEAIADSLALLLEKYGAVEIADNGQKALVKVDLDYYDAVISDINMPVMDGIKFYKAAVEADPGVKDRFMFYTSSFTTEHINFFIENDVPYLFKPAQVQDIESIVCEILDKSFDISDIKDTVVGPGVQKAG